MQTIKRTAVLLAVGWSALLATGCDGELGQMRTIERLETYCQTDTSAARAEFILQCIENANPKSDEEPEDWITKCQHMAEASLCQKRTVVKVQECTGIDITGDCWFYSWKTISEEPRGG
ncbi:MAG: hypothetical protein ACSHWQ_07550 [Spongiibacteraceae bacterium]